MSRARASLIAAAAAVCALGLAAPPTLAADGTATWISAPALAPPTPAGAQPSPYPVALGYVGDIEFWAPNRGLLITRGSGVVPEGLYAYNGVDWHQLSTVCGGYDGRIAWAGPDEFWTIADQRPGQVLPSGGTGALDDVSLCHFLDGQVVGSYAMPLDQPNSYQPMNAAACDSPTDCWFGGQLNSAGAFHLHWNGSLISVVNAPQDHEIASMTVDSGQIYESVLLRHSDSYAGEDQANPPVLHLIDPADANPFVSLFPTDDQDPSCGDFCPPLPEYGTDSSGDPVDPVTLSGLALSSDWRAGAADPQLWAAGGYDGATAGPGEGDAQPVVLFYQNGTWTQVVPNLVTLPDGDTPLLDVGVTPTPQSVAAEPGEDAAWIAVTADAAPDGQAHVDRIAITGPDSATVTDQDVLGDGQGVGPRGAASAIACPAAQDCWVATTDGWLYHLTNGTQLPVDTDPNFAGVITYRPPDSGVPVVLPPEESPGSGLTTTTPLTTLTPVTRHVRRKRAKPVVTHLSRSRLVDRTTLELSFTLTVRARVQLIARRHRAVVAETRRTVLKRGRHTVKLLLNVDRWPTALDLKASAVKRG